MPVEELVQRSVRIPVELDDYYNDYAKKTRMPKNEVMKDALNFYQKHLEMDSLQIEEPSWAKLEELEERFEMFKGEVQEMRKKDLKLIKQLNQKIALQKAGVKITD